MTETAAAEIPREFDTKGMELMEVRDKDTPDEVPGHIELVPSRGQDVIVFAKNPAEMASAQDVIIKRVKMRIEQVQGDLNNAQENLTEAKNAKIRTAGWRGQVRKYEKELRYYMKTLAALEAGFFIVPDFPISLIAVRTTQVEPTDQDDHNYSGSVNEEPHEELPVGEGHYVDANPEKHMVERPDGVDDKGKPKYKRAYTAEGTLLRAMDFPFRLVRPHLLKDLKKVADLKIFDGLGVLPSVTRRGGKFANPDPMILGIIENRNGRYHAKRLLFLISWWLPTGSI